jgi:hypothetical protein
MPMGRIAVAHQMVMRYEEVVSPRHQSWVLRSPSTGQVDHSWPPGRQLEVAGDQPRLEMGRG